MSSISALQACQKRKLKIDIFFAAKTDLEKDVFLKVVFPDAVLLSVINMSKN